MPYSDPKKSTSKDSDISADTGVTVTDWIGDHQHQGGIEDYKGARKRSISTLARNSNSHEKNGSWPSDPDHPYNVYRDMPVLVDEDEVSVVMESGPRGIVVVFGGFLLIFGIIGYVSVYGLFQSEYVRIYGEKGYTQSDISWIGSLSSGFQFGFTIICGPIMNRFGHKIILWAGCIIGTLGLLLASWCNDVWQIYLTQGIIFGIGASFLNLAATAIPPLWYEKHRGLAMGVCFCGAGVGGLALGFIIPALINKVDIWWTLRIYALMFFVMTAFSAIVMRAPRQLSGPPVPVKKNVLHVTMMKSPRFLLWFASALMFGFAYVIPFTFVPSFAGDVIGLDPNVEGGHLLSIMSGANIVGRIVIGFVGDRLGAYPVALFSFIVAPLSCILWMFSTTKGMLIGFTIIYGFFSGAWFTLVASITSQLVDLENLGSGITLVFLINTPGNLFTIPIASKIIGSQGYKTAIGYDIAMWGGTAMFMAILVFYDLIRANMKRSHAAEL
ncbi:hypothetical protein BGZ76_006383 [Entomortierella beljakovae]|nr:hypothetical protein BGZ76_006383 [Entomortierella beljakovae]